MTAFAPKRILVPLDFSDFSLEALETAADLTRLCGAELTVLHVMEELEDFLYGEAVEAYVDWRKVREEAGREARARLERSLEPVSGRWRCETLLVWGKPADEILRVAESKKFDVIVMSTHGRTGLSRLFMGSVAERVVRGASCPVLLIRGGEPPGVPPGDPPG